DGHIHDVSGGRENGGDHEEDQHCAANVFEEKFGADDAHGAGESQHDRQFKNDGEAQNDGKENLGVFVDGDNGLKIAAVSADQKVHGNGEDDLVSEVTSGQEEPHREHKERKNEALFVAVKPRRDEAPDLIQDNGRSHKNAGHQPDLQIQVEWLGGIEVSQVGINIVGLEYFNDRLFN